MHSAFFSGQKLLSASLLLLLVGALLRAQTVPPKTNDTTTPLHLLKPAYPVPYGQTKAEDVRQVLECPKLASVIRPPQGAV